MKDPVPLPTSLRILPDDWLNPLPLDRIFGRRAPLEVDIGCGKGRFLLAHAAAHPETNFLGIERMLRRLRKVDRRARRRRLDNIRLLRAEAYYTVSYLIPAESVTAYYAFFPDPWPKKRHQRHRLFDARFIDALHRTLRTGCAFHFATDHIPYLEAVRELVGNDPRFEEITPYLPADDEKTNFELLFEGKKTIGRCSFHKVGRTG